MRSYGLRLVCALAFSTLAGCGPEKEIPTEVHLSPNRVEDEEPAAPAQSEADAKSYVDSCLALATEGHRERLQKARINRSTATGMMRTGGGEPTPTVRKIEAAFPDRLRVTYDFSIGDTKQITIGLRNPEVWAFNQGVEGEKEFEPPNPKEYADVLAVDVIGQHWLPMLVPLAEPKTVVYGLKNEIVDNVPAVSVKASIPNCPVFTLWFNDKTKFLGQITYLHNEAGSKIHKKMVLDGHKPNGGLLLPTKIEFQRNGELVERWEVSSWELLDSIDDAVFDRPAGK